jgi:VWFA-related protein
MRTAFSLLFASLAFGQGSPTFQAGVSLVHIDAEVAAQDGRILDGFTKDDFRIFDNGKEQRILNLSAGDEALDLILLFDVSGSMRPKVAQVAAAAREGVGELRPGDRVAVMVFNTRTRVVAPFTEDLEAVQGSIQRDVMSLRFGGGTFIQSAVSDAARRLMREPRTSRRRAVLIITDDYGQRTRRESSVVRDLWEADALLTGLIVRSAAVQTIQTINTIMHPYMLSIQVGVKGIAEKTGGDFIRSGDPGGAFQESMRRIRSRYSLYYAMPEGRPGARRSLRVELSGAAARRHPKARVRARTGYIVPEKN